MRLLPQAVALAVVGALPLAAAAPGQPAAFARVLQNRQQSTQLPSSSVAPSSSAAPSSSSVPSSSASPSSPAPAPSSPPRTPYAVQKPPLDTDWTYELGTNPWPEYPRPQLKRERWLNLNGIWTWRAAQGPGDVNSPPATTLEREVLVPSCIQSGISGLQILDVAYMWFATTFEVPADFEGERILLNFEAVDYEARVFINGVEVGHNIGGYFRFSLDVTDHLSASGENLLTVFVHDPTDEPGTSIPVGKQTRNPSHIFYRACSGIWQTVWLEAAPENHITQLDISAAANGEVTVTVAGSSSNGTAVDVVVFDAGGSEVGTGSGTAGEEFTFTVSSPSLWSPETPTLYNLTVTLGSDTVTSYTGFRTFTRGIVEGVQRPLLNGDFVFQFGTLDQGYWPDGLHTPPNYEAMVFDLKLLKRLGMNMVRKHIKIEPDLFYRACDEIGLLVIQDMPSMPADGRMPNAEQQAEFARQLELMVREHRSYTSIVTWVVYNEGWGQLRNPPYPEEALVEGVRRLDPTRLVIGTSGWVDHGFGDFSDNHHYASPQCGTPFYSRPAGPHDSSRIGFQGEFGGIGLNASIENLWNVQAAIDTITETYEINADQESYDYRARVLLSELRDQVERFECSGAVYTQTTDVEGEVNGLLTYDRRIVRANEINWRDDIQALYDTAARRGGKATGLNSRKML